MIDTRTECAKALIVAIFRLAVADYLGHSYSHDGDAPPRITSRRPFRSSAAVFLTSDQAAYLADLIGFEASAIWRELLLLEKRSSPSQEIWGIAA